MARARGLAESRRQLDGKAMEAIVKGPSSWLALHGGTWVPRPDLVDRPKLGWLLCGSHEDAVHEYQAANPQHS